MPPADPSTTLRSGRDDDFILETGQCLAKELSSRPERTRISYYAAPTMATCAAFFKESRMEFDDRTNLDRKSGVA